MNHQSTFRLTWRVNQNIIFNVSQVENSPICSPPRHADSLCLAEHSRIKDSHLWVGWDRLQYEINLQREGTLSVFNIIIYHIYCDLHLKMHTTPPKFEHSPWTWTIDVGGLLSGENSLLNFGKVLVCFLLFSTAFVEKLRQKETTFWIPLEVRSIRFVYSSTEQFTNIPLVCGWFVRQQHFIGLNY